MKRTKKATVKLSDHTPITDLLSALCIDLLVYFFIRLN